MSFSSAWASTLRVLVRSSPRAACFVFWLIFDRYFGPKMLNLLRQIWTNFWSTGFRYIHSSGLWHDVPVMRRSWKHLHIIAIHWEFKLMFFARGQWHCHFSLIGNLEVLLLAIQEPASSTNCWNRASPRVRKKYSKMHLEFDQIPKKAPICLHKFFCTKFE